MENLDLKVLRTLRNWRKAGRHAMLVTVVRTWGSSPRPVGSIMAMCEDGAVVGSVSGGCIEDDLVARYARRADHHPITPAVPKFVRYGVSADEAHRFGLPCGGTLELVLEHDPCSKALDDLVLGLERYSLMRRTVRLDDGQVVVERAHSPEELALAGGLLVNIFGPEYRMLLIGAGQLTEYLAMMGLFSGFAVTVCDPREEHLGSWNVPGAALVRDMPDDVVASFRPDRRTCVVALTHDPKLDDLALLEALRSDAFYVGAIGSRRNNEARRRRFAEQFELNQTEIAKLRGPVGIYIGSKTPPEIAVSIMSEILAIKNGIHLPSSSHVADAKNTIDAHSTGPLDS